MARPRIDDDVLWSALCDMAHVADHLDIIAARQGALHLDEQSVLEAAAARKRISAAQSKITRLFHLARDRERKSRRQG